MKHALHNLIFTVGLVTTAVYTVKAINVVLPIARQIIEETVAEKITDAIVGEEIPTKQEPLVQKKSSSRVEFTISFPRRNKK
jgi:hypothetical protein